MNIKRKFEIECDNQLQAIAVEEALATIMGGGAILPPYAPDEPEDEEAFICRAPPVYYHCASCSSIVNSEKLNLEEGTEAVGIICPVCKSNIAIKIMSGKVTLV